MFERSQLLGEGQLPDAAGLVDAARSLARDWQVGPSAFLAEHGVASEAEFKRRAIAGGQICQHAQIGFRDPARTRRAWVEIYEACAARGAPLVRYGICLDWVMGLPRGKRETATRGTGLILAEPEDFAALANAAPVAPHFGDFIIGFPASVENTCAALAAGSTAIGNLGQYFTFRLPG
ncbi:MAG: hypothetical protein HKN60_04100 [Rhizobiales bacterium]|nr:hypothetical protein [Hyphomicrobiales bacterium]